MSEAEIPAVEKVAFPEPKQRLKKRYIELENYEGNTITTTNTLFESSEGTVVAEAKYAVQNPGEKFTDIELESLILKTSSGKRVDVLKLLRADFVETHLKGKWAEYFKGTMTAPPIETIADLLTLLHEGGHHLHNLNHRREFEALNSANPERVILKGVVMYMTRHENMKYPETHQVPPELKIFVDAERGEAAIPEELSALMETWRINTPVLAELCRERESVLGSLHLLSRIEEALGISFDVMFRAKRVTRFDYFFRTLRRERVRPRDMLAHIYERYRDQWGTTGSLWKSFNELRDRIEKSAETQRPGTMAALEKFRADAIK